MLSVEPKAFIKKNILYNMLVLIEKKGNLCRDSLLYFCHLY